jgi:hypothetical protein
MPDIFLENCVRSAKYECMEQAGNFHEQRKQIASALPKYNG